MKIPVIFCMLALFLSTCIVATDTQERHVLDILPLDVWSEIKARITDRQAIRSLELLLRIHFPTKAINDAFERALKHTGQVRFDHLLNEDTFMFDDPSSVLGDKRYSSHVRTATDLFNLVGRYNPRNGKKVQVLTISDLHKADEEVLKVAGEKVIWETVKQVNAVPLATLDNVPWSSMKSLQQLTFHSVTKKHNIGYDNMPFISPAALERIPNLSEITCDSDRRYDRDLELFLACLEFAARYRSESLVFKSRLYHYDLDRVAQAFSGNTFLKRLTVTGWPDLLSDILWYLPPDQLLELEPPLSFTLEQSEIDKLKKLEYLSIDAMVSPEELSQLTSLKRLKMRFGGSNDCILYLAEAIPQLQQLTLFSLTIFSDSPALKNRAFWQTLQDLPLLETIEIQIRKFDRTVTPLNDARDALSVVLGELVEFIDPRLDNEFFVFKRRVPF